MLPSIMLYGQNTVRPVAREKEREREREREREGRKKVREGVGELPTEVKVVKGRRK